MPEIGESKTLAVGFWDSQICDNSLGGFMDGIDPSWGLNGFEIDGVDEDNYVELKLMDVYNNILQTIKFTTNGKKKVDVSQYTNITSTQDIKIRMEITTWI